KASWMHYPTGRPAAAIAAGRPSYRTRQVSISSTHPTPSPFQQPDLHYYPLVLILRWICRCWWNSRTAGARRTRACPLLRSRQVLNNSMQADAMRGLEENDVLVLQGLAQRGQKLACLLVYVAGNGLLH